jgi:hypothetical protein
MDQVMKEMIKYFSQLSPIAVICGLGLIVVIILWTIGVISLKENFDIILSTPEEKKTPDDDDEKQQSEEQEKNRQVNEYLKNALGYEQKYKAELEKEQNAKQI